MFYIYIYYTFVDIFKLGDSSKQYKSHVSLEKSREYWM